MNYPRIIPAPPHVQPDPENKRLVVLDRGYRDSGEEPTTLVRGLPIANCDWCRWSRGSVNCRHPALRFISPSLARNDGWQMDHNRDGHCPRWAPSWWTRVLRFFGLRRQPLV